MFLSHSSNLDDQSKGEEKERESVRSTTGVVFACQFQTEDIIGPH